MTTPRNLLLAAVSVVAVAKWWRQDAADARVLASAKLALAEPDIEAQMLAIVDYHEDVYHPGYRCAENELGQCVDLHGGVRVSGPLGQRKPNGRPGPTT